VNNISIQVSYIKVILR